MAPAGRPRSDRSALLLLLSMAAMGHVAAQVVTLGPLLEALGRLRLDGLGPLQDSGRDRQEVAPGKFAPGHGEGGNLILQDMALEKLADCVCGQRKEQRQDTPTHSTAKTVAKSEVGERTRCLLGRELVVGRSHAWGWLFLARAG